FTNCISKNKLGWDDSAFSVFTTTSEDVEGKPVFHSDSSVKSSEHKPIDSTSYASTSSVSTSVNEAEIKSTIGTPIKEPISVLDLPSFPCNSPDKNEHTSRTSCNKNGSFNKKAGHFRKHDSSVSKLCFVCGSDTHLIKDCDFYKKQMTNKTIGIGVGPAVRPQLVPTGKPKVKPVPTGKPKVTPVPTGKPKVKPVPIGKPKVTPVPTGKPKVTPVPTGKPKVKPVPIGKPKETPFLATEDEGIFDSGCSRSMTGKGTIRTPTLDFENVYYVKELQQFNLFSISQICDKKNQVLFTDTECLVLSKDFKLPDDNMVVLKVPRKHNLYTINLNDLCPRGKQHKASYKAINAVSSISEPLQLIHMDLFGPTSIRSIDHKYYCLVITDDYSTQDADSDSDSDEQVIIVPFYPLHSIQGTQPIDTPGDKVDDSPFHLALGTAYKFEDLQTPPSANLIPPGCIPVPTSKVPVPTGSLPVPTGSILVPAAAAMVPTPGIFSSSSFDDEFDTALNNVASFVQVSPVATQRINTIHPQSLIIRDPTFVVQTRSKVNMLLGLSGYSGTSEMLGELLSKTRHDLSLKDIVKALYGLHQAPRAWYATLSTFLQKHGHRKGTINKTLFLKKNNRDIILVQVYVDDIIFGSTKKAWMATTPYEAPKPKSKNESDSPVNVHLYRSIIGSLMYLTASRPDIMFAVSECSRHQVTPTTSNLEAVKKIFKYLKGQPK
nr:hypothetical protein [Tanacetum cinerariifolium]